MKKITTTISLLLATTIVSSVSADPYARGKSVFERSRPNYEASGLRVRAFNVLPELEVTGEHTSNIFKTDGGEVDDFITKIKPSINVVSNWNLHEVELHSSGEFAIYDDNQNENYEDFNVGGSGRLDFPGQTSLYAGVDYSGDHEDRGSPDDVNGAKPTQFYTFAAKAGLEKKLNLINFLFEGETKNIDFDDAHTIPFAVINNDDRDRTENNGKLRIGYELPSNYEAFIQFNYGTRDYDSAVDDNGLNRDSDGYDIIAGTALEITGKITGDIFAGYQKREYDDAALNDIDGVTFGGNLLWNLTGLTSLEASVKRSIEETTLVGASGFVSTSYGAVIEHEVLRNLLAKGSFNFAQAEYEGGVLNRDDDVINAGAELKYLVNRNLSLKANYGFEQRETNVVGQDYDDNRFLVGINLAL